MSVLPLPVRTDRLLIRKFEARDRDLEQEISDSPVLYEHLPVGPRSEAELDEYMRARLEHETFDEIGRTVVVVVESADGGEYVGSMQLSVRVVEPLQLEIGWIALPRHHGQGLMTEAVNAVVDLVFDSLMAHRIVAGITDGNEASVSLAERVGFRKEAHFVQSSYFKGKWRDELVYSVLRDEWAAVPIEHE
jgi:RimJ/RimL family protein N-acetyltransferase